MINKLQVVSEFLRGGTFDSIAASMGLTRNQVAGIVNRAGLSEEQKNRRRRIILAKQEKAHGKSYLPPPPKPKRSIKRGLRKTPTTSIATRSSCAQSFNGIPLMGLSARSCRWPLWATDADPRLYCGCETKHGSVYCDKHHAIAYVTNPHGKKSTRI